MIISVSSIQSQIDGESFKLTEVVFFINFSRSLLLIHIQLPGMLRVEIQRAP